MPYTLLLLIWATRPPAATTERMVEAAPLTVWPGLPQGVRSSVHRAFLQSRPPPLDSPQSRVRQGCRLPSDAPCLSNLSFTRGERTRTRPAAR